MKLASLEKSLKVLDILSEKPQGWSLSELAAASGFPSSTLHHILSTFLPRDYVAQDPETKKYSLGYKFLSLSRTILDNIDVREIAHSYLRELHKECNEASHLAVLRNRKVLYVDKIQKQGGLSLATYVGFYTDPHAAAGGKVLISELSDAGIKEIYPRGPLKRYGPNTLATLEQLREELVKIRADGYAVDDEEYYEGVRCIAAPVRAGGKIVAAISVTGAIFTVTMERINTELKDMVMETAARISAKIHW
ncbi:MAG: IclR family transcriptional regulator [Deltaproteobacteria bacterium]